jgi:phosphatidylserine decarboxylase
VLGLIWLGGWLFWLAVLFALCCLWFFRDPERVPPARSGVVLAPADGRVLALAQLPPPAELGLGAAARWRVLIRPSLLDVQVNRVPADGIVARVIHRDGSSANADSGWADAADERNALVLKLADGRQMAVVQSARLVARRIQCDAREGDMLRGGDRFGLIRFSGGVELYLPEGVRPLVLEGQTMVGGETVLAELRG